MGVTEADQGGVTSSRAPGRGAPDGTVVTETMPPPVATTDPPLFWRADPFGLWIWSCPRWTRATGLSEAASLGDGWLDVVHPEDRLAASRPWTIAEEYDIGRPTLRLRLSGGRGYRAVRPEAAPSLGSDGAVREWVGAIVPASSGDPAPHRDVGELHHHMRNALAVIRSVSRRTARNSDSVEHYASHFEGRLDALARVQDAVIRRPDGGVDLETLIGEELLAHRVGDPSVRVEGPALRLKARAAEVFGLALHELVLNAVKFGAFSAQGAVAVRWALDAGRTPPRLRFTWRETGIRVVGSAPRRQGFGTETIERSLPYELNAETRLDFRPGEVCCTIVMPLTDDIVAADRA